MLRVLIQKEIREILLSRKFAVTFGVMAVLTLLSFYSGAVNYRTSLQNYESAVEENRRQLDDLTKAFNVPWRVFLRPDPMQSVISGVANDVGRTTYVSEWSAVSPHSSRFEEEPVYAVFRLLDFEFVVTVALSLFAIMFAFDAISGEKERGTLALLLSNSTPRDSVLLSKLVGSYVALGVPMLIPILIGAAMLPSLGVPLTSEHWARLSIIVLAAGLYLGVFLSMSVLASCLTRRSTHSFLILLVVWIITVQIVPRLAGGVSAREIHVLTRPEIVQEETRLRSARFREARNRIDELHKQGDQKAWEKFQDVIDELTERDAPIVDRLEVRRRNQLQYREKLTLSLSRVSPASVFKIAAAVLAGTSPSLDDSFYEQVKRYRRAWTDFVTSNRPDRKSTPHEVFEEPLQIGPHPQFQFASLSLRSSLAAALPDLALLAMFNLFLFAGAVLAFRRYDVRQE